MKLLNFLFVALPVIGFAGCATKYKQTNQIVTPRPLGEKIVVFNSPSHLSEKSTQTPRVKEPAGNITLNQALSLALMQNPELAAFSWEIRAMEAKSLQTGLLPNPELDFEAENFGGTGDFQGTQSIESTIQLSQLIELGGKRIKRRQIADLEKNIAGWDYETKRLDILTEATIAFVDVLAFQKKLSLTEKIIGLAEQLHSTVSERVVAGKVSPVEETKTGIALSTSRLELGRAKRSLDASKKKLAAVWGSTAPAFKKVDGNLEIIFPIPSVEQLTSLVDKHPDLVRWATEIEKQQAAVEYAEAGRIPDITVSGGVRMINESDNNAFVVGLSIPLPLLNRNQGEILKSRYRLAKAKEEQQAAKVRVHTYLQEAYQALSTSFMEANAWKNQILPGSKNVFEAVREGYRHGKFGLLDVLDAQRIFFESKSLYIEALEKFHKGVASVERLTGIPLERITNIPGEMKGNIK